MRSFRREKIGQDLRLVPDDAVAVAVSCAQAAEREVFPHRHAGEQAARPCGISRCRAGRYRARGGCEMSRPVNSISPEDSGTRPASVFSSVGFRRRCGRAARRSRRRARRGCRVVQDVALAVEGVDAGKAQDRRGTLPCGTRRGVRDRGRAGAGIDNDLPARGGRCARRRGSPS